MSRYCSERALSIAIIFSFLFFEIASSACPYSGILDQLPQIIRPSWLTSSRAHEKKNLAQLAVEVDYKAVKEDLVALLTDSQPFWPADNGNYGPLFIRLAWHCAGSYRIWDGRGGCDGGRQRFDPERSWPDNTNLDKARSLLRPIKLKYGPGLSWGDLIILSGTVAIEAMGGPSSGFCAGRVDDPDGFASLTLGLTEAQQALAPCAVQGNCSAPLGANVIGLIYVDPHGFMGNPVPEHSAPHIRDVFARMSMNDSETVALIGGGHAFGKAHGACPTGAGPDPKESPEAPWPGTCGSGPEKGKGNNTFTAGFELQWTTRPTEWTNEYFHNLLNYDYKLVKSPGDAPQFAPVQKPGGPAAPPSEVGMLTTDVALIRDPAYLELVKLYAKDISQLENDFGAAWYKLVTRDMGPATRCINADAPPPQPFQYTLPDPPKVLADFSKVAKAVKKILRSKPGALLQASASTSSTLRGRSRELLSSSDREGEEAVSTSVAAEWIAPDTDHAGNSYYGALLVQLAWQCASTFRSTDYQGGCNGARIRLSPQKDWEVNKGMNELLMVLTGIKSQFDWGPGGALSWADLIVIAGTVALEDAAGTSAPDFEFCGGRVDARHGDGGPEYLAPRDIPNAVLAAREEMLLLGLTPRQAVALQARLRSLSRQALLGYSGSWNPASPDQLSNSYFKVLLNTHWEPHTSAAGKSEFKAAGQSEELYMLPSDLAFLHDPEFLAIAEEFASDNAAFLEEFAVAWKRLMNADRYKGSLESVCP